MSFMNNFIHEYKCVIAILQNIVRVRKVESLCMVLIKNGGKTETQGNNFAAQPVSPREYLATLTASPVITALVIDLLKELKVSLNSFWKTEQNIKYLDVRMHSARSSIHHNDLPLHLQEKLCVIHNKNLSSGKEE